MTEAPAQACRECLADALTTGDAGESGPRREFEGWSSCRHSPDFPDSLRELADPPAALFGLGERSRLGLLAAGKPTVTVVGARRTSAAGSEVARLLAFELASAGVTVVSGLARGIDSAAHSGAISTGNVSVAVLGSGPDICYPRSSAQIYRSTVETGLVVSELTPGSAPRPWTFPARNRLMAALGQMTVVVEGRRSSGSLITAAMAAELGREVGAVPGSVLHPGSEGVNALLRDGAQVIRSAQDILDSIFGPGYRELARKDEMATLDDDLQRLLDSVEPLGSSIDEIASRYRGSGIQAGLARLELMGLIARDDAGGFRRSALRAAGPL